MEREKAEYHIRYICESGLIKSYIITATHPEEALTIFRKETGDRFSVSEVVYYGKLDQQFRKTRSLEEEK